MFGEWWIVVEYDTTDVRAYESDGPIYIPTEPCGAEVVFVESPVSEEKAIDAIVQRGGHYAAFPMPDVKARKASILTVEA